MDEIEGKETRSLEQAQAASSFDIRIASLESKKVVLTEHIRHSLTPPHFDASFDIVTGVHVVNLPPC